MAGPSKAPTFEDNLNTLEQVVKQLEAGDLPLEDALRLFEQGMTLSDSCRKQLEEAETRVEVLIERGNQVRVEPLQDNDDA